MNKNIFSFTTTDHLTLPWLMYTPEKETKEIAFLLHGNGSSSVFYSMTKNDPMWKQITDQWIAFVAFNNRGAHYHKKFKGFDDSWEKRIKQWGMAFELLKECIIDIDSIVAYFKWLWYEKFHLIWNSTWANKICTYDWYTKETPFSSYLLLASWDDTGLFYEYMGKENFMRLLEESKEKIEQWLWEEFVPRDEVFGMLMSYQSLYDTINPDGDYNTFPYNEHQNNLWLSKEKLFRYFAGIAIPTTVVYGELDEYSASWSWEKAVEILKQQESPKQNISYKVIPWADHWFGWHYKELATAVGQHFTSLKS